MLPPAEQQQVATGLEQDAEVMTNTQLEELLADQPPDVQAEIIRINTEARPIALQIALLIPILASLLGLVTSFRMGRLPDPVSSGAAEGSRWPDLARPRCRVVSPLGFEPRTKGLKVPCSTAELRARRTR